MYFHIISMEWMRVASHLQIRAHKELLGGEAPKRSTNKAVQNEKMSQLLSLSAQMEWSFNQPLFSKVKISCGNGVTTMLPMHCECPLNT